MGTNSEKSEEFNIIDKKYSIIIKIGSGGYGKVYLAKDITTQQLYAIKVLDDPTPDFEKEVSILEKVSSLKNPYVINLISSGENQIKKNSTEKSQYLILEYASKGDFYDYIEATETGLERKYAKFIFRKIVKGVQAIHESGFCHRDLKMENILLDEFFNPKICDFGLATELKGKDGSRKKLSDLVGTPGHYAPEILERKLYDGIKVDIFCLGIILINITSPMPGFWNARPKDPLYKYIINEDYSGYSKKIKEYIGEK